MWRLLTGTEILATLFCVTLVAPTFATPPAFVDPLDAPAIQILHPDQQPLIAISQAGKKLIAVGPRGLITVSGTDGQSWRQAQVSVQSDLVAVQFLDDKNGWAVGHNGIILHSMDGGISWVKQLDGRSARGIFENFYNQRIKAGDAGLSNDLQEIQSNFDPGAIMPWLGVWFTNDNTGYVVGPFGDIAHTDDGGKSWQPWLEHIDNPNFYDLNAIGMAGNDLYIVGEQGTVYIFDSSRQKFLARPTSYDGSLFGLVGNGKTVIVYGLRGSIFRSTDQGKTWIQSKNLLNSSIMDGVVLPDGKIDLVTVDGTVLVSTDDGVSFEPSAIVQDTSLSGIAADGNKLVMTSLGGIRYAFGN